MNIGEITDVGEIRPEAVPETDELDVEVPDEAVNTEPEPVPA